MKNILITGASGNLGKSVLAAFENESEFHINITSREEIRDSGHLKAFYVDLTSETSTASMVHELTETQQQIDAAIFLTGAFTQGNVTQHTSTNLQKMISINVATAHNIAAPLMQLNRQKNKPLYLIFIGAKAAMLPASAVENAAYSLSKMLLFNYAELINESENEYGTLAYIILPGTMDTAFNRQAMPNADFAQWTNPDDIANYIKRIVLGEEVEKIISL